MGEIVVDLLKKNETEGVKKGSTAYIKLCRGVLRAQLKGIEIEKKHMSGDFSETLEASLREQLPSGIPIDNGGEKGQLTSEVIHSYGSETEVNWQDKTKDENLSILNLFVEVLGDVPIQSIARQTLQRLSPNIQKNRQSLQPPPKALKRATRLVETMPVLCTTASSEA